jgi:hypothetical protein
LSANYADRKQHRDDQECQPKAAIYFRLDCHMSNLQLMSLSLTWTEVQLACQKVAIGMHVGGIKPVARINGGYWNSGGQANSSAWRKIRCTGLTVEKFCGVL